MTISEIADFLFRRIDEEAQIARDAGKRSEEWLFHLRGRVYWDQPIPESDILAGGKPIFRTNPEYAGFDEVEHVVTWDPKRVLADCAARRRIVARCASQSHERDPLENGLASMRAVLARQILLDLAATYADHEDYREDLAF